MPLRLARSNATLGLHQAMQLASSCLRSRFRARAVPTSAASGLGRGPSDMERITVTDRLSAAAPAGSSR